jgi:hypothetical protein
MDPRILGLQLAPHLRPDIMGFTHFPSVILSLNVPARLFTDTRTLYRPGLPGLNLWYPLFSVHMNPNQTLS